MAKKIADEMTEVTETTYKGSELIRSADGVQKDVFTVVLKTDRRYTAKQAEELTKKFLTKEVK